MPRAVIADRLGPVDAYEVRTIALEPPRPGCVRIAVRAAGVSFVDVLTAQGRYQVQPPTPFIPGSECAGVVEALGEGVAGVAVGDAVMASAFGGTFAEAVNVKALAIQPKPDGLSFAQAAVFPVSYLTAWHALVGRGQLREDETVLVLGAGGATGYAAVQVAKHLGARVIAGASDAAKRDLALTGGADAAVATGARSWREAVDALAPEGVDLVFDPVGGAATEAAFRCLKPRGRHLVVGFPAGIPSLPTNLALMKGASLIGVNLRRFSEQCPASARADASRVAQLAEQGVFRPSIAAVYPLERFAAAMAAAEAGRSAGRIVISPDPAAL